MTASLLHCGQSPYPCLSSSSSSAPLRALSRPFRHCLSLTLTPSTEILDYQTSAGGQLGMGPAELSQGSRTAGQLIRNVFISKLQGKPVAPALRSRKIVLCEAPHGMEWMDVGKVMGAWFHHHAHRNRDLRSGHHTNRPFPSPRV